ncbi:MAG: 4Fe-4S dicluster domain-containing protein [Acidimicrobiia bacterium]|nr:4Fe-4S dicluster domain-containing protein [Acidimicrobiia bacterium]
MAHDIPPLTPFSLDVLLGRVAHEFETRHRIFDLPTARFWQPESDVDLSFEFLGRPAATPVGPAAGPHSQLAQNIILSWLGGARLFELKTVQILDELEIARPCIDMETVGFNTEWSQELKIAESIEEYVKAWMMIHILAEWEPLRPHIGATPGPFVFDMSVGYDLAGIASPSVAGFIESMMNATGEIERLRSLIPGPFAEFRDMAFPTRVADTVTLSTFHGCPPDEIESITKHLMDRHELDVIVKLNPTLLGFGRVCEILQQQLGYEHIRLQRQAFVDDLQFPRGVELIRELRAYAAERDRRFGIKLTNTLVVDNHKGFLGDDPMYLSGPPLHVLATTLLDELMIALPNTFMVEGHDGDVQVSFSAGITKENLSEALGMGVRPTTVCSDLLKPGGYGRLAPMLKRLAADLREVGASNLGAWRRHQWHQARAAGYPGAAHAHMSAMLTGDLNPVYHLHGNEKLPRHVDHELEMWGCVACNFCVTVCPNDAFFRVPTPDGMDADGRQQYFVLVEACNECGNCMVFCPEVGDPALIKPRIFTSRSRFEANPGQGFLVTGSEGTIGITAAPGFEGEVVKLRMALESEEGIPLNLV